MITLTIRWLLNVPANDYVKHNIAAMSRLVDYVHVWALSLAFVGLSLECR
jgi:anionic cell wall polymer biosynthesis LytR-Cps2A-Psr (LCP) family protein